MALGRWKTALVAVAAVGLLGACAEVPKESVKLANTVGRDISELERAHRALATQYFGAQKAAVNQFIDTQYAPAFITNFAAEAKLDQKVEQTLKNNPTALLPGLTEFVNVARARIDKKRQELLGPIEAQEKQVLTAIADSYQRVLAGNQTVSAYLASVVEVREMQNELLSKVGLGGLPEKIGETTADVSRKVSDLNKLGGEIDSKMEKFKDEVQENKDKVRELRDEFKKRFSELQKKFDKISGGGDQ